MNESVFSENDVKFENVKFVISAVYPSIVLGEEDSRRLVLEPT